MWFQPLYCNPFLYKHRMSFLEYVRRACLVLNCCDHPEGSFMQSFRKTNELHFAVEFNFCSKDTNKRSSYFCWLMMLILFKKKKKLIEEQSKVRAYLDGGVALLFQVDNAYWLWTFQGRLLQKNNKDRFCQLLWRPRPATLLSEDQIKVVCSTDMPVDVVLVYMHARFIFLKDEVWTVRVLELLFFPNLWGGKILPQGTSFLGTTANITCFLSLE